MDEQYLIDIKNIRDLRFYLWKHKNDVVIAHYLNTTSAKKYNYNDIFSTKPKLAVMAIDEAYRLIGNHAELHLLHAKELKKMQGAQLQIKEFDWFKKCSDACYFVWIYVRVLSNKNIHLIRSEYQDNWCVYIKTIYCHLECEPFPESHKVRIESIIDFFDRCDWDLHSKLELMKAIKTEWYNRSHSLKPLPLKQNEKKKIQWAWTYIWKDKGKVQEGARKRELLAQDKTINKLSIELSNRLTISNNLTTELENKYNQDKKCELIIVENELLELRRSIANELNKKSGMDMIRKTHLHSSSFLSLFMPCSINETYLALVCAYHFLYCKDPHFIPRLSKAWESSSYRKSKKKSKKKPLETISSELSYGDHVSEVLSPSEGDVVKIEKDTLRENMHEVVIEKVIENVENKNPDLSDGQDNDPFSSLSSIALLGI